MRIGLCLLVAAIMAASAGMARGQTATAPGTPTPGAVVMPPAVDSYRICPGDTLSVSVEGEQNLTRDCQVSGAGTISDPLLGDVKAAGETCSSLADRLRIGLTKYIKKPQVTVTIRQYGQVGMSVFVMGEVARPGAYPLVSGSGIMQPLASAGGMTNLASGEITILKPGGESRTLKIEDLQTLNPTAARLLDPGDVIVVNRKKDPRYSVLGEVPTPGMFDMPLQGDARVLDAMASCGLMQQNGDLSKTANTPGIVENPTRTADLEHAVLTRSDKSIPLNLAALLQGDTSQNLVLQPGDVLTVPRRPGIRVAALGEVRSAGRIYLPENSTVLDLLNAAGGTTSAAKPGESAVMRVVSGKPTSMPVDLGRLLTKGDAKQNIALQEGDVLFVPAKGAPNDTIWRLLPFWRLLF